MSDVDRRVVIVGGGGHAKVVIDVMRAAGWMPVGILDPAPSGPSVLDVPVLGDDALAGALRRDGYSRAFVAIGQNDRRRKLGYHLRKIGFEMVTAIHPTAVISSSASIGSGVVIMSNAVANADAKIADFVIVNTGAIVEHDCLVGEAAHLAPRSVIGGNVQVGEEVLFGIGAAARPESVIGARTIVGAGAVVIGRIAADTEVIGVPARRLLSSGKRTARPSQR